MKEERRKNRENDAEMRVEDPERRTFKMDRRTDTEIIDVFFRSLNLQRSFPNKVSIRQI
jgi:hypothetical protein